MITFCARFCLFIIFSALVSLTCQAQADEQLPRGALIEKVVCRNNPSYSYALYLPSGYTPEKKWPVLYLFDPFARGRVPVEVFSEAAEHNGYLLVGSNNSQNNISAEKLSEIISSVWADTHARLSLDEKRAYAAGLSGGARVATYFASSCRGCVAGVIVCGATFPSKFPLDKQLPFAVYGLAGFDDFNYPELVKTFDKLMKNGTPSHLKVFEGRHGWPPKELASDALAWLNLRAMKDGRLEMDKSFVEALLAQQLKEAQAQLQKGDVLTAARMYETLVSDFKDISDTRAAAEKLVELRRQKSFQKSLDEEKKAFDEQQRAAQGILAMSADLLEPANEGAALRKISVEIESWRERTKEAEDSSRRRLARRVLEQVVIEAYETALYVNERQKDYKMMIANMELTRLVNPQSSNAAFDLARAFVLDNRKKDSLNALEQAVKNGFADCARINAQAEWKSLRADKGFQNIISRLHCAD